MRKRIFSPSLHAAPGGDVDWWSLAEIAEVEVSSEDSSHPIENAFAPETSVGWRAGSSGQQTIRLLFDQPQRIRRIQLVFLEDAVERQHEFTLSWSPGNGSPWREIVRQQFHFSPAGAVRELEDYKVDLASVGVLELQIIPDRSGSSALATLASFRVA